MDATPPPELCDKIQAKLQRWAGNGEAAEYYNLKNRGPHKPTVTHPLNRFGGNMGPYADALLPLRSVEYINASPIDNLGDGCVPFVATMCPKRETFAHFWSMVWELGSRVIVNLTHEKDRVGSSPADKRERYWPPLDDASTRSMARWPVRPHTLGYDACEQVPSLLRYHVELTGPVPAEGGERPKRVVWLYWYARWVDFPSATSIGGRPFYANAWAVLHMAIHVARELEALGHEHWAVCHCSAGVGRTGTFLALVHLLRMLPSLASSSEEAFDAAVTATIEAMRDRRLWMVKTDVEYATLYAALLLRMRNPDDREFALSWPLHDGERGEVPTPSGALLPVTATLPAAEVENGGGGSNGSGHGAGAGAAAPPPLGQQLSAGLQVRTPEDEEMDVDTAPPAETQHTLHGGGSDEHRSGSGARAGESAGSGGAPTDESMAESSGADLDVDNAADVAHYAGVGAGAQPSTE